MEFQFGKKISSYRHKNQLTIQELAERTGLSTAIISQMERGLGNPTLSVLQSVANEIGISLSDLIREEVPNQELVVRKEQRKVIYDTGNRQIMYNLLSDNLAHSKVNMVMICLFPHCETVGGFNIHSEEEELYILQGKVHILFEKEEILLLEGDTIRILPFRGHKLRNDTDEEVLMLNIKSMTSY